MTKNASVKCPVCGHYMSYHGSTKCLVNGCKCTRTFVRSSTKRRRSG